MKASPGSCLGCRWARTREGDWVSSRSVIDVGVIIRHVVENFVHALQKEIPSAFLRATGKRLRIEAATSMRVYYRRTGCSRPTSSASRPLPILRRAGNVVKWHRVSS